MSDDRRMRLREKRNTRGRVKDKGHCIVLLEPLQRDVKIKTGILNIYLKCCTLQSLHARA